MSDESITLTVGAGSLELGRPFPLTVVRAWRRDGAAPEWSDAGLAPLTVTLRATTRRDVAGAIEETRSYDAWAFERGELTVAPAGAAPLRLRVESAFPEELRSRPGAPELPSDLLRPAPPSRAPLVAGASVGLLLLIAFILLRRRRTRKPPASSASPTVSATERALARLRALESRGSDAGNAADVERDVLEGAALLRDWLFEEFELPATRRTTEELQAAAPALVSSRSASMVRVLARADRVKFARHAPDRAERATMLRDVDAALRGTGAP